jgi:hypothetical protein
MTEEQRKILDQTQKAYRLKRAAKDAHLELQAELSAWCVDAHDLGLSDRQIAEHLGGISRTRINQLRSSVK